MEKLKLALDALHVESLVTDRAVTPHGTVKAHDLATDFNECGISNPCTTDGQATIDAQLCGTGGGEGTIGATTCRNTGICCGFSAARTNVCCQGTANCG
jgi:hypothetical protein